MVHRHTLFPIVFDSSGIHGLHATNRLIGFMRDNAINLINRTLASANVPALLEPKSLCRVDGKRPDSFLFFHEITVAASYETSRVLIHSLAVIRI
jgi:hypothetical protein